jgi:hypothetical protein
MPGQKAPFYIDFFPTTIIVDDLADWADVTNVKVTVGHLVNSDKSMYQGLTVPSEGGYRSGVYTVVGKVENVGTETIGDVRVITTFYDASGKVVSLNYTEVFSDKIAPGTSKTFTATPIDHYSGDNIANYDILVQSTIQQPDGTNPTNNPSNTKRPTNSATAPTASPKLSFELTRTTIIIIIVTILAIASIAIVLVTYKRRKPDKPQHQQQ